MCSPFTYSIVLDPMPKGSQSYFVYFPEIPSPMCITSEGVPPRSPHSTRPLLHLQLTSNNGQSQRVFFSSKTRHPTALESSSSTCVLCFIQLSQTNLNKSSVFFNFNSANLAHLLLRLGCQEGVLIHHCISCSHLATTNHL